MAELIDRPEYLRQLIQNRDVDLVKIVTGIRRCGKSSLLELYHQYLLEQGVAETHIIHMNLESLRYRTLSDYLAFYDYVSQRIPDSGKTYLIFDELQAVSHWEKAIESFRLDYDVDIYITGSNSRMMSSEISTYLTGRYVSFRIYTLSFEEYLMFKERYASVKSNREELAMYIKKGGFPATHLQEYGDDEIYTIVKDIYRSTIFSDIVRRNQIRKVDRLERIVKYAFDNVGNTFSSKSISDYLKSQKRSLDNETVYAYLEKLEKAYLLHRCPRYDLKGKEILKTQEKYYLADTSLRYSVLGYKRDTVASSLENVVYLELCRRGYKVYIGKTADGEVDFVASRQGEKLYVQVTQEIHSEKTEKREYERLLEIKDNYPKYVLTMDKFDFSQNGIIHKNVIDWLLEEK